MRYFSKIGLVKEGMRLFIITQTVDDTIYYL